MKNKSLISIIVPIYNAEKYISRCVESILNQTFRDWELILIDDGSKDQSLEICREYELKDSRVRVISKANGGVSSARNCGINNAKGEFIIFIDADDYIKPKMLEKLYAEVECKQAEVVFTGYEVKGNAKGTNDIETLKILARQQHLDKKDILTYLLSSISNKRLKGYIWRILIKRESLEKNNIRFREGIRMSEDFWFLLELILITDILSIVPEELYVYYMNTNSVTARYISSLPEDMHTINEWMKTTILPMYPDLKLGYLCCVVNTYLCCIQNICRQGNPCRGYQKIKQAFLIKDKYNYTEVIKKMWLERKYLKKNVWLATIIFRFNFEMLYMILYKWKKKIRI